MRIELRQITFSSSKVKLLDTPLQTESANTLLEPISDCPYNFKPFTQSLESSKLREKAKGLRCQIGIVKQVIEQLFDKIVYG